MKKLLVPNAVELTYSGLQLMEKEGKMNDTERRRLEVLLGHRIEHNKEHAEEFKDWADKAKDFGEEEAYEYILEAAQQMNKASDALGKALNKLKEGS